VLSLIRKRLGQAGSPAFAAPDAGGTVYAIGDIHGRHDLLLKLLDRIFTECAGRGDPVRLVFLGDYVDRGEGVRETVDVLSAVAGWGEVESVFLQGNHEQMLLRFLREPATGTRWLRYGGLQTLLSYGIGTTSALRDEAEAERVGAELAQAMGPHVGFLEGLRPCHRAGNVFFAHAGADPAQPVEEQDVATLLWGCPAFLSTRRSDGVWVVHGHIIVDEPTAAEGRVNIDTGAYYSGRLTAARIAGGEVAFIHG
jgi:serine/threonine protein phosphatase 1